MLRDRSVARRTSPRQVVAAAAIFALVAIAGCGIKGPLKRAEPAAAPTPATGTSPALPDEGDKPRNR